MTVTSVVGDVATVVDCEHRTAPRAEVDAFGFSIGTRDVRNGRISLDRAKPVSRETFESWTRRAVPRPGDLIFSREAPMGEVGAVPTDVNVCLGQRTVLLQPDDRLVDHRFLRYSLMSPAPQAWISENSAGSTVLHINVADVRRIPIPHLPHLDEQRRIIDILEDHLSRIDAAEAYLSAVSKRAGLLFEQHLVARVRSSASVDRNLSDCLAEPLTNGRSVPSRAGGFPVLRLTALKGYELDLSERKEGAWTREDAARFLVERGDFLISRGNGSLRLVGRGGLVADEPDEVAFPDTLIRARPNPELLDSVYLSHVWNSRLVRAQIERQARTTAGIYKVNQKQLGQVTLPVPSLSDQVEIAGLVDEQHRFLANLTRDVERGRARGQSLRRSLLAAAFGGQLTGHSSDFNRVEEVASA